MRKFFTLLLVVMAGTALAQPYNNEWIKYNQTYFKFKIGSKGLYRIPKSTLDAAGIGNTQVQFLELWRNGEQVPFYPSVPSGVLPANGYIEFWGLPNDGKADKPMYRDPAYQHTTVNSLITDSAAYFLSVNANQSGFITFDGFNDVSSNTLPVEPYFMHTVGSYYKLKQNLGFAAVVGEYVYSSSYDKGEYWSSNNVFPSSPHRDTLKNLKVFGAGPASTFTFGASGIALNPRNVRVAINGTDVKDTVMDYFNDVHTSFEIPTAILSSDMAALRFTNTASISSDRYVISYVQLNYPRTWDFNGASNFEFRLPADNDGYYLEITNFNGGSTAPVLYDLSFGTRYVGDISTPGRVKFVLPASTAESRFVLVSEDNSNIRQVNSVAQRNFENYTNTSKQGNYLMISHPLLNIGTNGRKPVDEYQAYRS